MGQLQFKGILPRIVRQQLGEVRYTQELAQPTPG